MSVLAAPPLQTSLVEVAGERPAQTYLITRVWNQWLLSLTNRLQSAATILKVDHITTPQSASLPPTSFPLALAAGLFRVSWYARVVQTATTSSSLVVTIGFTDGGVGCQQSGPAMTGNTLTTTQSGSVLVQSDQATALTYATTYSSTGATPMKYTLTVMLEQVG